MTTEGYAAIAAAAGEAVVTAEEAAASAALDLEDLMDNIAGGSQSQVNERRKRAKEIADAVAGIVTGVLKMGEAGKIKVGGAAAAAGRFAAARPKIKEAEESFVAAEKLIKDYHKAKERARTSNDIKALNDKLREARELIAKDIEHLKDALEEIEKGKPAED